MSRVPTLKRTVSVTCFPVYMNLLWVADSYRAQNSTHRALFQDVSQRVKFVSVLDESVWLASYPPPLPYRITDPTTEDRSQASRLGIATRDFYGTHESPYLASRGFLDHRAPCKASAGISGIVQRPADIEHEYFVSAHWFTTILSALH